jgi:hypothetical protein
MYATHRSSQRRKRKPVLGVPAIENQRLARFRSSDGRPRVAISFPATASSKCDIVSVAALRGLLKKNRVF